MSDSAEHKAIDGQLSLCNFSVIETLESSVINRDWLLDSAVQF